MTDVLTTADIQRAVAFLEVSNQRFEGYVLFVPRGTVGRLVFMHMAENTAAKWAARERELRVSARC